MPEITMPALSPKMEVGTLARWLTKAALLKVDDVVGAAKRVCYR